MSSPVAMFFALSRIKSRCLHNSFYNEYIQQDPRGREGSVFCVGGVALDVGQGVLLPGGLELRSATL